MRDIDAITGDVIDVSLRIHRELGPGLLESVYETVLAGKLIEMGYLVNRQKPIDIEFEGNRFDAAFRADLLVDNRLLVEIKCVDSLNKAHLKQLQTYLRLTKQPSGCLSTLLARRSKRGCGA